MRVEPSSMSVVVPTNQMADYINWMAEQGHYRKHSNTVEVATNEMYFTITYAALNAIEMKRFQEWRKSRHKD